MAAFLAAMGLIFTSGAFAGTSGKGARFTMVDKIPVAKLAPKAEKDNCQPISGGQVCDVKTSHSEVSLTDKTVSKARLTTKGALLVRWEFPNGWKPRTQVGCIWVTGGTNSYISVKTGRRVWIDWNGKRAYICPDRTSSTGWRKAGGPPTWEPCGNEFIPPFKPRKVKVFRGKIAVQQNMSWQVTLTAKASVAGNATATAVCTATGVSASANAEGHFTASANVTFTGRGRTLVQATSAATAGFNQAVIQQGVTLAGQAEVQATGNLTLNAQVQCQGLPPTPTTAPVSITKVTEDANGNIITTPSGTFTFQVTCDGATTTVVYNATPQAAGQCTVGGSVTITENSLSGWTIMSGNPQTFTVTNAGVAAVFKNKQVAAVPPPPSTAPVTINKQAQSSNGSSIPTPTGTFTFQLTCGSLSQTLTYNGQTTVNCQVGTTATVSEINIPSGWTVVSANPQSATVGSSGVTFTFIDREVAAPPPPAAQLIVNNVTQPQEVFADGETYPNICADVYAQNGDSVTVVFSAIYGSFPTSTFTFTSSGHDRPCTTYKAPNTPDAVGKNDQITATAHDNATGQNASAQSQPFPIKAPPPRP